MISIVIHYSTIDFRFLESNIKQCIKFSNEIIIPICTHLFNGEKENKILLNKSLGIISKYKKCIPIVFKWDGHKSNVAYYHNLSRKLGTEKVSNEWVLLLDADEIPSDTFKDWFETVKYTDNTYWMSCNWFFREPIYRAKQTECAGLLIKTSKCIWNLDIRDERNQLFNDVNFISGWGNTILDANNKTMIDHYSWVRSKEEMLKKVNNWGHVNDRNWTELVEIEFTHPFNGTDFVHGYKYDIVENKYNL